MTHKKSRSYRRSQGRQSALKAQTLEQTGLHSGPFDLNIDNQESIYTNNSNMQIQPPVPQAGSMCFNTAPPPPMFVPPHQAYNPSMVPLSLPPPTSLYMAGYGMPFNMPPNTPMSMPPMYSAPYFMSSSPMTMQTSYMPYSVMGGPPQPQRHQPPPISQAQVPPASSGQMMAPIYQSPSCYYGQFTHHQEPNQMGFARSGDQMPQGNRVPPASPPPTQPQQQQQPPPPSSQPQQQQQQQQQPQHFQGPTSPHLLQQPSYMPVAHERPQQQHIYNTPTNQLINDDLTELLKTHIYNDMAAQNDQDNNTLLANIMNADDMAIKHHHTTKNTPYPMESLPSSTGSNMQYTVTPPMSSVPSYNNILTSGPISTAPMPLATPYTLPSNNAEAGPGAIANTSQCVPTPILMAPNPYSQPQPMMPPITTGISMPIPYTIPSAYVAAAPFNNAGYYPNLDLGGRNTDFMTAPTSTPMTAAAAGSGSVTTAPQLAPCNMPDFQNFRVTLNFFDTLPDYMLAKDIAPNFPCDVQLNELRRKNLRELEMRFIDYIQFLEQTFQWKREATNDSEIKYSVLPKSLVPPRLRDDLHLWQNLRQRAIRNMYPSYQHFPFKAVTLPDFYQQGLGVLPSRSSTNVALHLRETIHMQDDLAPTDTTNDSGSGGNLINITTAGATTTITTTSNTPSPTPIKTPERTSPALIASEPFNYGSNTITNLCPIMLGLSTEPSSSNSMAATTNITSDATTMPATSVSQSNASAARVSFGSNYMSASTACDGTGQMPTDDTESLRPRTVINLTRGFVKENYVPNPAFKNGKPPLTQTASLVSDWCKDALNVRVPSQPDPPLNDDSTELTGADVPLNKQDPHVFLETVHSVHELMTLARSHNRESTAHSTAIYNHLLRRGIDLNMFTDDLVDVPLAEDDPDYGQRYILEFQRSEHGVYFWRVRINLNPKPGQPSVRAQLTCGFSKWSPQDSKIRTTLFNHQISDPTHHMPPDVLHNSDVNPFDRNGQLLPYCVYARHLEMFYARAKSNPNAPQVHKMWKHCQVNLEPGFVVTITVLPLYRCRHGFINDQLPYIQVPKNTRIVYDRIPLIELIQPFVPDSTGFTLPGGSPPVTNPDILKFMRPNSIIITDISNDDALSNHEALTSFAPPIPIADKQMKQSAYFYQQAEKGKPILTAEQIEPLPTPSAPVDPERDELGIMDPNQQFTMTKAKCNEYKQRDAYTESLPFSQRIDKTNVTYLPNRRQCFYQTKPPFLPCEKPLEYN